MRCGKEDQRGAWKVELKTGEMIPGLYIVFLLLKPKLCRGTEERKASWIWAAPPILSPSVGVADRGPEDRSWTLKQSNQPTRWFSRSRYSCIELDILPVREVYHIWRSSMKARLWLVYCSIDTMPLPLLAWLLIWNKLKWVTVNNVKHCHLIGSIQGNKRSPTPWNYGTVTLAA